ncbi:MAG: cysteine desulfurase [Solobacterium sp.]|nr:cysteine desulfurase [Solobacterium sp.]
MQNKRVYLDHASTSAVHPEVLKSYKELLDTCYVNSESLYDEGTRISRMMEKARSAIAGLLEVDKDEIIFTSGSSESNTSAIKGVCFARMADRHIITTCIEHSSIMNACACMHDVFGYDVTYLPVDQSGRASLQDLVRALRPDTALVSIMAVNNEVGSVNDIAAMAEYVKKHSRAVFHCDLTQAIGKIDVSLKNIDLASLSAHKIEGLKGSGILVRRRHVPFVPLINGGEQEAGLRGGTSNAPVNMVFAKTLRLALENQKKHEAHIRALTDRLLDGLREIGGVEINTPEGAAAGFVNFSYEPIPSEVMQNALNRKGFMVSARSTCDSKNTHASYVLKAMGFSEKRASSCIRATLSYHNTEEEIDVFLKALKEIITQYGTV